MRIASYLTSRHLTSSWLPWPYRLLWAAYVPLTTEQLEDWVLADFPEFVESTIEAEEDLATGRTRSLEDAFGDDY